MPKLAQATDFQLAHLGLRLLIGINILLHGAVRLPKLSTFAHGMSKGFEGTWLPPKLALPFAFAIPAIELTLGVTLILGIQLRLALLGSLALMCMLTAGVCLQENWAAAGVQLVYGLVFAILLATRKHAAWTLTKN